MNIVIVRAFITVGKSGAQFGDIKQQLAELRTRIGEHDTQLAQIYDSIENMPDEKAEQKNWEKRERIDFVK